jgi:hypothetical protein
MILKGISSSKNLNISERLWEIQREQGAVIEEPADGEEGDVPTEYVEKDWTEKPGDGSDVLDIRLGNEDRGLL